MKRIRFATIGTNYITDRFLSAALQCPELEYAALYSRTEERGKEFAGKYGISTVYTDLEALAGDPSIDAVYIASPTFLHCRHSVLMLTHGKHVLCEKPVASNEQELQKMLTAAAENSVIFMEAMRCVFGPGFDTVTAALPRLGTIRRATLQYCQYSGRYDNYKNGIIENAFKPELSNGALMDIGSYCVHALGKLFGRPDKICAQAVKLGNGADGAGSILCLYPQMQAELIYSKITNSSLPSQIQGENGNMIIREICNIKEVTVFYRNGETESFPLTVSDTDLIYETQEWIRLILSRGSAAIHNESSLIEMQIMDEARRQMDIVFPADR